jgi:hypothetical protein
VLTKTSKGRQPFRATKANRGTAQSHKRFIETYAALDHGPAWSRRATHSGVAEAGRGATGYRLAPRPTATWGSSTVEIVIGGIVYFILLVTLGVITLRKGHWVMFIIGIFIPLFWIIGALIPRRA